MLSKGQREKRPLQPITQRQLDRTNRELRKLQRRVAMQDGALRVAHQHVIEQQQRLTDLDTLHRQEATALRQDIATLLMKLAGLEKRATAMEARHPGVVDAVATKTIEITDSVRKRFGL